MKFSFFSARKRNAGRAIAQGDAARDARQWQEAAEAYGQALEIDPGNAGIWVQRGHALKESGLLKDAEWCYRKAIGLQPRLSDNLLQLGHVLKLLGRTPESVQAYLDAYRLDPSSASARQELRACGWTTSDLAFIANTEPENIRAPKRHTRAEGFAVVPDQAGEAAGLPEGYARVFPDVDALCRLGLVSSAEQHFLHYGYRQGRKIVMSLEQTPPSRVFVLCPSFFKRCGIGEHARYLANCIEAAGHEVHRIRSTRELDRLPAETLRDAVLIVNHGPGLFDGYNPELSEGEATTDLLANLYAHFRRNNLRPVIFMHSLLDKDNEVMFPRQQLALEFPIPVVTTIESAARTFNIFKVEHGMQPMVVPEVPVEPLTEGRLRDRPVIGFFGFFQWGGKNFDALFNTAERLKAKLVGSVATREQAQIDELHGQLSARGIHCDIGTGWVEDHELARRLAEADFHYLPQHDYDHWNNSGTARFVMNFCRPVLVPPHNPFLDLRNFVLFADENDMPALVAWMRDDAEYAKACARIRAYGEAHPMLKEMPRLATDLVNVAAETGVVHFLDSNVFCTWTLMGAPESVVAARCALQLGDSADLGALGAPDSAERAALLARLRRQWPERFGTDYPVAQPIQYWRDHYELADFLYPDPTELIFAAYRCMLKREPSLIEMRAAREVLRGAGTKERTTGAGIVALLARLSGQQIDLDCAPNVQLYLAGKALDANALNQPALAEQLEARIVARLALMPQALVETAPGFTSLSDLNLFQLLMLPKASIDQAVTAALTRRGHDVAVEGLGAMATLMERYVALNDILARAGLKPSEVFLMDRPIVPPAEISRRHYAASEFLCLEGDALVIALIRAVKKRDPNTLEMFALSMTLDAQGPLAAVAAAAAMPFNNAVITGLDDAAGLALAHAMASEQNILIQQMRSPHGGGWQLRNDYLEARRNYDRLWLRLKRQKDIWWAQGGGDIRLIATA